MRVYSFYTPTHKVLVDEWFLPSVKDDFEVVLEQYGQECASGEFMDQGWNECMVRKVDLIIRGVAENPEKLFIHSDVDIQFFRPVKDILLRLMKNKDMLIQRESPWGTVCPGFVIMRGNEKNGSLWEEVRLRLVEDKEGKNDQDILNEILCKNNLLRSRIYRKLKVKDKTRYPNAFGLRWGYLPMSFFSPGAGTGRRWIPGSAFDIPEDIALHHANWTVGVQNKISQLRYVKEKVLRKQS
ncbi:MAG: hypothetical protein GF333_06640 [Candidatus Omnitrophica bacterium]|nr:hypothetical protein [Candidatus Omnitrophota bacterium]